jgi:hypothetical protein
MGAAAGATPAATTDILRERCKVSAGERRSSARASILAWRRDSCGTPQILRGAEAVWTELVVSLDFEDREVFSPPPLMAEEVPEAEPEVLVEKPLPHPDPSEEEIYFERTMEKINNHLGAAL